MIDEEAHDTELHPPNDLAAERALLGSMLLDEGVCRYYCDTFRPEFFFNRQHAKMFSGIKKMLDAGDAVDIVTLTGRCTPDQADRLHEFIADVPSAANADTYAKGIRDCWHRQQGFYAAHRMMCEYADPSVAPAEVTQRGITSLESAREGAVQAGWRSVTEVMQDWEPGSTELWDIHATPLLNANGWHLRPGLLLLSGSWGAGKTTLALQIGLEVGELGAPFYIWSRDMSDKELCLKLASCRSKKPEHRLTREDIQAVKEMPFRFDDSEFDLGQVLSKLRQQAADGVRWFMLDYLELLKVPGGFREAWQRAEEAVKRIKVAVRDLNVYFMLLQSSTKDESIRGSNELGHASDQIWWLSKPEDDKRESEPFILRRQKHRKGDVGKAELRLLGHQNRFVDWEQEV
jgi:replicative DNA helicase